MKHDGGATSVRNALPPQNTTMTPEQHRSIIDRLHDAVSHTIEFVAYGEGTCGTYAFALWDEHAYRAIAGELDVFAGKDFFGWVIPHLEELPAAEPECLAVYFKADRPEHVGLTAQAAGRIRSKWGMMPIYEHGTFEVTSDYGDEVRFFRLPLPDGVMRLFLDYATERAGSERVERTLKRG